MRNKAENRAILHQTSIIDQRSLRNSHKRLAELLEDGMTVLDIGCGTGAITRGIAEMVGEKGRVIGVDNNPEMIRKAKENHPLTNLSFEVADIYDLPYISDFDIVTASRVLQWLDDPQKAMISMKNAVNENGTVIILDYNHEKINWQPEPPSEMTTFYQLFLKWREDAGMDNAIADHIKIIFEEIGLHDIRVLPQHEKVKKGDQQFQIQSNIWAEVARFKGKQMVEDDYLDENQRAAAEEKFRSWIEGEGMSQSMYLLSVEGKKNG